MRCDSAGRAGAKKRQAFSAPTVIASSAPAHYGRSGVFELARAVEPSSAFHAQVDKSGARHKSGSAGLRHFEARAMLISIATPHAFAHFARPRLRRCLAMPCHAVADAAISAPGWHAESARRSPMRCAGNTAASTAFRTTYAIV